MLSKLKDKWCRRHIFTEESQKKLAAQYVAKLETENEILREWLTVEGLPIEELEALQKQLAAMREAAKLHLDEDAPETWDNLWATMESLDA